MTTLLSATPTQMNARPNLNVNVNFCDLPSGFRITSGSTSLFADYVLGQDGKRGVRVLDYRKEVLEAYTGGSPNLGLLNKPARLAWRSGSSDQYGPNDLALFDLLRGEPRGLLTWVSVKDGPTEIAIRGNLYVDNSCGALAHTDNTMRAVICVKTVLGRELYYLSDRTEKRSVPRAGNAIHTSETEFLCGEDLPKVLSEYPFRERDAF